MCLLSRSWINNELVSYIQHFYTVCRNEQRKSTRDFARIVDVFFDVKLRPAFSFNLKVTLCFIHDFPTQDIKTDFLITHVIFHSLDYFVCPKVIKVKKFEFWLINVVGFRSTAQ
jgi:hypothetical protein